MFDRKKDGEQGEDGVVNDKTVIGVASSVKGDFVCDGDVVIFGKVTGAIRSTGMVAVGDEALIEGNIKSSAIVVAGKVMGNITCEEQVKLKDSAYVEGDMSCASLDIDDGAFFSGATTMKGKKVNESE